MHIDKSPWLHFAFLSLRHWMLSSFPAIGNHITLQFIKEKFIAEDLTYFEAAQALMLSVQSVAPDLEAIKLLEASWYAVQGCFVCLFICSVIGTVTYNQVVFLSLFRAWLWPPRLKKIHSWVRLPCWALPPWLINTVLRTLHVQLSLSGCV